MKLVTFLHWLSFNPVLSLFFFEDLNADYLIDDVYLRIWNNLLALLDYG